MREHEIHKGDMRKAGEIFLRALGKPRLILEDVIKMDRKRIGDNCVDSGRAMIFRLPQKGKDFLIS